MPKIVDHQERRLAFAEAAYRVIARSGIDGLTVREIAKEAGFTTGALSHYFQSKDQVLIQAASYIGIVVRAQMQDSQQSHKGLKALRLVVHQALPMTPDLQGAWRVWLGLWQRSGQNREVGNLMQMRYFEWLDRVAMLVEGAQATGELAADIDAKLAAQTIVAAVDGIGARVMLAGYDIPSRQQKAIIDNVIDNLPRGEGRPTKLPGRLRRKSRNGDAASRP
jgi:AcrR family transcriptional regulator